MATEALTGIFYQPLTPCLHHFQKQNSELTHLYPILKCRFSPDIDECALGKDDCDANAGCVNTEGSYECNCNPGYFRDGLLCKSKVFHMLLTE